MLELLRRPEFVRMLLPMNGGAGRDGRTNEEMVRRLKRKAAITECVLHGLLAYFDLPRQSPTAVLAWLLFECLCLCLSLSAHVGQLSFSINEYPAVPVACRVVEQRFGSC